MSGQLDRKADDVLVKRLQERFSRDDLSPLGGGAVSVRITDFSLRLSGLSEELLEAVRERYHPFIDENGKEGLSVEFLEGESSCLGPDDGYLKLEEASFPGERVLLSNDFSGTWNEVLGRGRLFVSAGNSIRSKLTAFENYFRWLAANLLIERGGFLFHSAGLVRNGSAYLFFGHSGAGKSTVTEFSPGAGILSDDLVLVLPDGAAYRASTTPFFGVMSQREKETGSFPLRGCFRLRKSDHVEKKVVSKAQAFGLLIPSCPNIMSGRRRNELLYPALRKFLDTVPVYELFFRKDASFWEAVLDHEAEGGKR